jgi:AcrR family transcriptional regulator
MRAPSTVRDLRRGQIIDAARKLVAKEGLEKLTIGELERRLSFTRGVITYHFKSKEEIVDELLSSAIREIDAATRSATQKSSSPAEMVRAVLRETLHGFLAHAEAARILMAFWGRIPSDARARRTNARLYAAYRRQGRRLIEVGRAAGAFTDVDADAAAVLLVGMVLGIASQVYFEPGAVDAEAALELATEMVLGQLAQRPRRP